MISSILNDSFKMKKKKVMDEFIKFKNTLEIITTIKVGDKLSKLNNNYYIDESGMTQRLRRWWYSQNRKKTFADLTKDFMNFTDFLDNLLTDSESSIIINKIILFINDLMIGLYNLKITYPDYKNIRCKIDSIIMTLIDFKNNYKIQPTNKLIGRRNSFD